MKHILLFLVIFLFFLKNFANSQNTFTYEIATEESEYITQILETDIGYIFLGYNGYDNSFERSSFISLIDKQGNQIQKTYFNRPDTSIIFFNALQNENGILIVGEAYNNNILSERNKIFLFQMNENFEIIKEVFCEINSELATQNVDLIKNIDNKYIVWGLALKNSVTPFFVLTQWSENLELENLKEYPSELGGGQVIRTLTEKSDLTGYYGIGPFNSQNRRVEFDLDFKIVSYIPIYTQLSYLHAIIETTSFLWHSDTTYLISQTIKNEEDIYYPECYLKISLVDTTNHTIINQVDFDYQNYYDRLSHYDALQQKGDYLYLASTKGFDKNLSYPYGYSESWISLRKMDLNLNIIWEKLYGGEDYFISFTMLPTEDGGCLLSACRSEPVGPTAENNTDAVIFKVDANGDLHTGIENPTIAAHNALLYPNPAKETLNLRTAVQYVPATLEVYNISGIKVFSENITATEQTINIASLTTGNYIFRIIFQNEIIETGKFIVE